VTIEVYKVTDSFTLDPLPKAMADAAQALTYALFSEIERAIVWAMYAHNVSYREAPERMRRVVRAGNDFPPYDNPGGAIVERHTIEVDNKTAAVVTVKREGLALRVETATYEPGAPKHGGRP
jgi:hypothetical protein